jgi:hypothetical protein
MSPDTEAYTGPRVTPALSPQPEIGDLGFQINRQAQAVRVGLDVDAVE